MPQSEKTKPVPLPPFTSIHDAVNKLANYSHVPVLVAAHINGKFGLIEESVSENIFRAFRGVPNPSKIYREWAGNMYAEIHDELQKVKSQVEYDKITGGMFASTFPLKQPPP